MMRRRRVYAKRRYTRRLKKAAQSVTVRGPGHAIVPDRLFTELKYFKVIKMAPASGTALSVDARWSGNSVYNCDADITTNVFSALGFLKLGALYNNFRVYASKCTIKAIGSSTGSAANVKLALCPTTTNVITTASVLSRFPYAKTRLISNSSGMNIGNLSNYMTTKKMFGLNDIKQNNDFAGVANNLFGNTVGVPLNQWYWHIACDSINGSTVLDGSLFVDVELTYYVEFFNRVHIQVQETGDDSTVPDAIVV